jgi:MarR family transcriptional regulator, organic hydroperoxide resistance regulator
MPSLIKFEDTVAYRLAKVTTAFRNSLERHMSRIGLHGGQVFLMLELWKEDGLRQIDLATRLGLAAPTVNKMLKGLIEINLITRSREDADARSTRIFLTDLGYHMREDVEEQWVELEQNSLSAITETERLVLFELLGKLRTAYTGQTNGEDEE